MLVANIMRKLAPGCAPRPCSARLAGTWDAFGTGEFGFDIGDVAFGKVVEELPTAVFLLHLRQHGIGERCAAFAVLSCGGDPVAQIGKVTAEGGDAGGRTGVAVPGDKGNRGVGGKFGDRKSTRLNSSHLGI